MLNSTDVAQHLLKLLTPYLPEKIKQYKTDKIKPSDDESLPSCTKANFKFQPSPPDSSAILIMLSAANVGGDPS